MIYPSFLCPGRHQLFISRTCCEQLPVEPPLSLHLDVGHDGLWIGLPDTPNWSDAEPPYWSIKVEFSDEGEWQVLIWSGDEQDAQVIPIKACTRRGDE